jgi:hypothetical protein
MLKSAPDHHDAQLIMQLYDLRRDAVMRESRRAIAAWWPRSFDEIRDVTKTDHPLNAPYRQVGSYWEMAYSFVKHGVLNADILMETGGEGLFVFSKVSPWSTEIRSELNPRAFVNAEWLATETEPGRQVFARFAARAKKIREQTAP